MLARAPSVLPRVLPCSLAAPPLLSHAFPLLPHAPSMLAAPPYSPLATSFSRIHRRFLASSSETLSTAGSGY